MNCQVYRYMLRCRYLSAIMDAMDATKCVVPQVHYKNKAWNSTKNKLSSQYAGFIFHGVRAKLFMLDDELGKNGNAWGTILLRCLKDEFERRKEEGIPWPEVFYLQMDNGPDNKNNVIFMLGQLLVKVGIFKKVKYSFLPVGHTHEDIDALFGALSKMLCRYSAFCLYEIQKLARNAWKGLSDVHYLHVRNFLLPTL